MLARWLRRYTTFIATKRGLGVALHSGVAAFESLPAYFRQQLEPALQALLAAAVSAHRVRDDVEPYALLRAVGSLSSMSGEDGALHGRRMVDLLIDGLRVPAPEPAPTPRRRARGRRCRSLVPRPAEPACANSALSSLVAPRCGAQNRAPLMSPT